MAVFALTLIRHGQTEFNKKTIIQGQLNVPLSDVGKHQSTLLGHRLQNEVFTHIYSSDLDRAIETARGILKQNHASKCAIIEDNLLRERKFGTMEGKSVKCLKEAANKANMKMALFTPPDGETPDQVRARVLAFFQQLCKQILGDAFQDDDNPSACTQSNGKVQMQYPDIQEYSRKVHVENSKSYINTCSNKVSTSEENILHTSEASTMNNFISDKIKTENSSEFLCQQQLLGSLNCLNDNSCINEGNIPTSSKCSNESKTLLSANVLVVSHGGLIRELICYLVEACGCSLPGGSKQAFKIAPNASFTKFVVCVKIDSTPEVKCLYFHDIQHLNQSCDDSESCVEKSL